MRVLIVLSSFGFWGEELVAPLQEFDAAGIDCEFATPYGHPPAVVDVSMDPDYVDPPLDIKPTSPAMAEQVRAVLESGRLAKFRRVCDPARPTEPEISPDEFDALLLVGGSGPILDVNNCRALHRLIQQWYLAGKLVACECYAVGVLPFTRHPDHPTRSIISGRRVTGHPLAFDYTTPYGFANVQSDHPFMGPPIALEHLLRDAVGPDGEFLGDEDPHGISVVVDHPFLTSRSVPESRRCGQLVVELLQGGTAGAAG